MGSISLNWNTKGLQNGTLRERKWNAKWNAKGTPVEHKLER